MNKLVIAKMKDEMDGVVPKMHFLLVHYSSEHKKGKIINNYSLATIKHTEYKYALLNDKCWRHTMKKIRSKNHKIGTFEINKISCHALMIKYMPHKKCTQWISFWLLELIMRKKQLS